MFTFNFRNNLKNKKKSYCYIWIAFCHIVNFVITTTQYLQFTIRHIMINLVGIITNLQHDKIKIFYFDHQATPCNSVNSLHIHLNIFFSISILPQSASETV